MLSFSYEILLVYLLACLPACPAAGQGWPVERLTGKRANKLTGERFSLPTRLGHAGNFAIEREVPKANTADAEPAQVRAAAATLHAAVILPYGEFGRPLLFFTQSFSCHSRSFISSY
jgi:hypothetical protein